MQPEISALTVFLVREDLAMFSKDGLMNTRFQLQSLEAEWLLLLKGLNLRVSKATRSGWYVLCLLITSEVHFIMNIWKHVTPSF